MIRELLISFIDGENLEKTAIASETDRLAVTDQIISIAVSLEKVGYYHSDLQCRNIIRRQSDGAIYFIEFGGGITYDFHPKNQSSSCCSKRFSRRMEFTFWERHCGNFGHVHGAFLPRNISIPFQSPLIILYTNVASRPSSAAWRNCRKPGVLRTLHRCRVLV